MIENTISLSKELRRFWELEETPLAPAFSVEDEICESLFASEHRRLPNGRYSVPLPRRSTMSPERLGDTLSIACQSLDIIRRRMSKDNAFREQYEAFMRDYESHRHMEYLAKDTSCSRGYSVYIPHHVVWQASDRGKKLRVVFDASRRPPGEEALNKLLLPRPSLQTDLLSVILRWRRHKIVFSADINMMYRQILIRPEDTDLQRILWQQSEDPEPKHYRLLTLTYGMNCAPYLALRTLAQSDRLRPKWRDFETGGPVRTLGISWDPIEDTFRFQCPTIQMGSVSTKRQVLATIARLFDPVGWLSPTIIIAKILLQKLWKSNLHWDEELSTSIATKWVNFLEALPRICEIRISRWLGTEPAGVIQIHGFADASQSAYAAVVYAVIPATSRRVGTSRLLAAKTKVAPLKTITIPRLELCAAALLAKLLRHVIDKFVEISPTAVHAWTDSEIVLAWLKSDPSRWEQSRSIYWVQRTFLDECGILRVGGRLQESGLPYSERHPVILPKQCHLSTLVIKWAHQSCLHGGQALTYAQVIKRTWIIGGRQRTKALVRRCLRCTRSHARPSVQLMGNLPAERVTRARPFARTGLDYAGPFQIKSTKGRRVKSSKGYLAIFVCLSTKAVHLEVVGDLTTESFLAAVRLFSGRRGMPHQLWSDNATTFRGADTALQTMFRDASIQWPDAANNLANSRIQWRFIPPSAPHFAGLWEAAVKSAKSHLKRVIGTQMLTYEEFNTLTVQVEGALNSRPLTPLSGRSEDREILTPGHLLTGSSLLSIPEPSEPGPPLNNLDHWRLVQAMYHQFWLRWSREYLNTLQQRSKWTRRVVNLQENDLVLILDTSLLHRNRWPLGRVVSVHPGADGLVRAATVRTASGEYVRPITKLSILPSA